MIVNTEKSAAQDVFWRHSFAMKCYQIKNIFLGNWATDNWGTATCQLRQLNDDILQCVT